MFVTSNLEGLRLGKDIHVKATASAVAFST
jgi:hypothetical protein